jgi:hypothetical protein
MEAEVPSETFVPIYKTTWRQITEGSNFDASLTTPSANWILSFMVAP